VVSSPENQQAHSDARDASGIWRLDGSAAVSQAQLDVVPRKLNTPTARDARSGKHQRIFSTQVIRRPIETKYVIVPKASRGSEESETDGRIYCSFNNAERGIHCRFNS